MLIRSKHELSKEAKEARKPLPPEYLIDALHDRLQDTSGKLLAARPAKMPKRKRRENADL